MKLKSLAEIAFDAYQAFAVPGRKFDVAFNDLLPQDKLLFERIAARVHAEVLLRTHDQNNVPMSDLDCGEVK